MWRAVMSTAVLLVGSLTVSHAQSAEEQLKARFVGRQGGASEDRRVNEFDLRTPFGPGPKTGCHGDTLQANVTIRDVDVKINGAEAVIKAHYSGKYTRQGWIKPCIHSPPPRGREDRNVSGMITMVIRQIPFKHIEIRWGAVSNVGEVTSAQHDSNRFAIQAAKNALMSAM